MQAQQLVMAPVLGRILLRIGSMLLLAGAGSKRVVANLTRIAASYGYAVDIAVGTRAISLTLHSAVDEDTSEFSGSRSTRSLPGVNFTTLTEISTLSWALTEGPMTIEQLDNECARIEQLPHYSRILVIAMVGIAGMAFCYIFGGGPIEMIVSFLATAAGLSLKQSMMKRRFNSYLITFCCAFAATFVVAIFSTIFTTISLENAFATCALFLIPGVPLIVSFIDLLDGYIINGLDRGVNALIHAFAIAAGLAAIIKIFQLA